MEISSSSLASAFFLCAETH